VVEGGWRTRAERAGCGYPALPAYPGRRAAAGSGRTQQPRAESSTRQAGAPVAEQQATSAGFVTAFGRRVLDEEHRMATGDSA
jgi:hypothetical protein